MVTNEELKQFKRYVHLLRGSDTVWQKTAGRMCLDDFKAKVGPKKFRDCVDALKNC